VRFQSELEVLRVEDGCVEELMEEEGWKAANTLSRWQVGRWLRKPDYATCDSSQR